MGDVEKVPLIREADVVAAPNFGETIPSSGMAKSIVLTGRDPTNVIPQPLPETVNPRVVEANEAGDGGSSGEAGTVTQAGGE